MDEGPRWGIGSGFARTRCRFSIFTTEPGAIARAVSPVDAPMTA